MSNTENKVQFNLKNVHYAVLKEPGAAETAPSWDTPVHVPGAVNINLADQGSIEPFYADGIVYYRSVNGEGSYKGDLQMARFPDQMHQDIWGAILSAADKVLTQKVRGTTTAFALLFQIDGDANNDLYVLYNCAGTRPAISSETNTGSKNPQTQSSSINADPLPNGLVFARTTKDTPDTVRSVWFKSVYVDSEALTPSTTE